MAKILELRDLCVSYGAIDALKSVLSLIHI